MEGSERAKRTANKAKDQVIVALRRLEEIMLQPAAKDQGLRGKQRAIDRLCDIPLHT